MKNTFFLFLISSFLFSAHAQYPTHWWKPVPKEDLKWWEISPDSAKKGEVVLSKRNELGLLSNFAATPFVFRKKKYPSLEGLWQSMKYPESKSDPRFSKAEWPFTRAEVEKMDGHTAKKAGGFGSKVMKKMGINWVTFEGVEMVYRTSEKSDHYQVIKEAMLSKLNQNPKVKQTLLATGSLNLRPDHKVRADDPPAWRYYQIWMDIRRDLQKGDSH
ncbi:MAG: hypothetical protein HOE90_05725 [Bacteriovoracaceae bacterium]|nr:hypothetical protein [Bacteriovoracaceae bacterium]